jgi:hypothetical protein
MAFQLQTGWDAPPEAEYNAAGNYYRVASTDPGKYWGGAGAPHQYDYFRDASPDPGFQAEMVNPGEHDESGRYFWAGLNTPEYAAAQAKAEEERTALDMARLSNPGAIGQAVSRSEQSLTGGGNEDDWRQELAFYGGGEQGALSQYYTPEMRQAISQQISASTPQAQSVRAEAESGGLFGNPILDAIGQAAAAYFGGPIGSALYTGVSGGDAGDMLLSAGGTYLGGQFTGTGSGAPGGSWYSPSGDISSFFGGAGADVGALGYGDAGASSIYDFAPTGSNLSDVGALGYGDAGASSIYDFAPTGSNLSDGAGALGYGDAGASSIYDFAPTGSNLSGGSGFSLKDAFDYAKQGKSIFDKVGALTGGGAGAGTGTGTRAGTGAGSNGGSTSPSILMFPGEEDSGLEGALAAFSSGRAGMDEMARIMAQSGKGA